MLLYEEFWSSESLSSSLHFVLYWFRGQLVFYQGFNVFKWGIKLSPEKNSTHVKVHPQNFTLKISFKKFDFFISIYSNLFRKHITAKEANLRCFHYDQSFRLFEKIPSGLNYLTGWTSLSLSHSLRARVAEVCEKLQSPWKKYWSKPSCL